MLVDFYCIFERIGPQLGRLAWARKIGLLGLAKSACLGLQNRLPVVVGSSGFSSRKNYVMCLQK